MADKVWTAAEVEAMSPAGQDDLFNSSVVTELDDAATEFLARVRSRLAERVAGIESPNQR